MSKTFPALYLIALTVFASAPIAAQDVVGHPPAQSPFRDVESSQHLTLFAGYFSPQNDEIGATPRGGPAFGLRYDIPVAGPAEFFTRIERVNSHRLAFDPTQLAATRSLGDQSIALYLADVGFTFNLTGRKSWHGVIPAIGFGLGVVTAPAKTGKDPYSLGTEFSFSGDAGLRFVPSNSYEFRLMAGTVFYQNRYPTSYYAAPTGTAPLLSGGTARSGFRAALNYSAGFSVPLFR